ncbi:hypothetical protein, partial [Pseudonocardia yunnanensis]|uniref:hypothetical protein n=1 Tax=Pseudonocardia yunnanensis TaxID=58107 RepID=UPI0031D33B76
MTQWGDTTTGTTADNTTGNTGADAAGTAAGTDPAGPGAAHPVAAGVYVPDGRAGPGVYREVELAVVAVRAAGLVLPEVTVLDERGGQLFGELFEGGSLVCDPAGGGGPVAGAGAARSARAFGVVNTG